MILLPGKCRHYGLGFVINKFWSKRLKFYEHVNDLIAIATFATSKNTTMKIINIYGPTQAKSNENKSVRDQFYDQLESILAKTSKQTTIFIAGDYNSKIGEDHTNTMCIGKYARGRRNDNGQQLVEFCEHHQLVATNTLFAHRASHRTTWSCQRKDPITGKLISIFNQIDFILTHKDRINLVSNARSYSGTHVTSDHRIVIKTTKTSPAFKRQFGLPTNRANKPEKFNLDRLIIDETVRKEFQNDLNNRLADSTPESAKSKWSLVCNSLKAAATQSIGLAPQKKIKVYSPELEQLSTRQHQLRLQIANCKEGPKKRKLKSERNHLVNTMHKLIKQHHENDLERRTHEIESLKDSA